MADRSLTTFAVEHAYLGEMSNPHPDATVQNLIVAVRRGDLPSLKDTDVEAARLLDPSLQYNAGH